MRVLFVGDGRHDVGHRDEPLGGVVPALVRRLIDNIAGDSKCMKWADVPILRKADRSFPRKVESVALLATKMSFDAIVCVGDQDNQPDRLKQLEMGVQLARTDVAPTLPIAFGIAVRSIEAWTLGAPSAIAAHLDVERSSVETHYRPSQVEEFYQNSGKPEKRPKPLLDKIARMKRLEDCTDFRVAVAERTDIDELKCNCPEGFAPFAKQVFEKLKSPTAASPAAGDASAT